MDATESDAEALGRFWADVLGTTLTEGAGSGYRVEARPEASRATQIWVNVVPEARIGKTRVHLDLRLPEPDPSPLVALGARVVTEPGADPWWVLADPDGNLFCAFPPRPGAPAVTEVPAAPFELVVDCGDSLAQATWWAAQVGGEVRQAEHGEYAWIEGAAGFPWDAWVFGPVPEPKGVKNRVHWDVTLEGPDPEPLLAAGAVLLRRPDDDIRWWILADPEGNEFCAFPADQQE
ncbi:VOC family protein [Cryptosporangium minutisporangium]|uniref:VOC family protein n=1 Tax=Cryptosporangium minutisporangium TaxID=113569 RepID=UPI0031E6D5EC